MEFRFNDVSERDMDLLFMEEFAVNREFLNLFIKKIKDADLGDYEIISEEVSYVEADLGESDLTVVLSREGHRVALLIEDKINAIAQPRQYERYVERGKRGVEEHRYDSFYVFLIAPEKYLENNSLALEYPLHVTYEECRALFEYKIDARSNLKYRQLDKAIETGHRPYNKIVDATATRFWESYVRYMQTYYPDIALKSEVKAKSKNGDWPTYQTVLDMKTVYIHHKMKMKGVSYSYIDLTFNGLAEHRERLKEMLHQMLGKHYDPLFGVHKAGKSAVLRIVASKSLDWQVPFEEQIDIVREHLELVSKLCEVAKRIDKSSLVAFYEDVASKKLK